MYYMVCCEHSTGCSSPPEVCCADFDELDAAQGFVRGLKEHNLLSDAERREKHISRYDVYDSIRLCIVLEEASLY